MNDHGRRAELYSQFQSVFVEHVPAILLYQPIYTYGLDRQVRNPQIAPMPDPSGRFSSVSRWAILEKEVTLTDLNDQVGDKLDSRSDP
jgi:ABC-type transport system substrate-binding protein